MPHNTELNFLCDVFQKHRIPARTVSTKELTEEGIGSDVDVLTSPLPRISSATDTLQSHTLYRYTDQFRRTFLLLIPNDAQKDRVLCIGPYFSSALPEGDLLKLAEDSGIAPQKLPYFKEYLGMLPILESGNPLFSMLYTLCEHVWETVSFSMIDLESTSPAPSFSNQENEPDDAEAKLLSIKTMEQRYAFENQLIRAVSLGQLHMESQLFSAFSGNLFERRTADPLRNSKNYCIIMNTLLRKAAEDGGVHPLHLDRISSDFATRIEELPTISEISNLMCEMFRAYCRLVRKHSVQKYSFAVQKAILLIDLDLSANITPSALADSLGVSLSYLCALFRRETGTTLSEHIRRRRIDHAKHLLKTTDLQVQTVALHCGIMDVQYFSKIFKKETGRTPKEYREAKRAAQP